MASRRCTGPQCVVTRKWRNCFWSISNWLPGCIQSAITGAKGGNQMSRAISRTGPRFLRKRSPQPTHTARSAAVPVSLSNFEAEQGGRASFRIHPAIFELSECRSKMSINPRMQTLPPFKAWKKCGRMPQCAPRRLALPWLFSFGLLDLPSQARDPFPNLCRLCADVSSWRFKMDEAIKSKAEKLLG